MTALTGAKGPGAVLGPAESKYREVGGAGTRQGSSFWLFRFPPKAFYHRPRRQALWPQCSPPGLGGTSHLISLPRRPLRAFLRSAATMAAWMAVFEVQGCQGGLVWSWMEVGCA